MAPSCRKTRNYPHLRLFAPAFAAVMFGSRAGNAVALTLDEARWDVSKQQLIVKGAEISCVLCHDN